MKTSLSLTAVVAAISVALAGCSFTSEPDPELTAKIADLEKELDKSKLAETGKLVCIDAVDEAVEKSDNMPVAAHDPRAEFVLQDRTESAQYGMMHWDVTVFTSRGLPFKHRAHCTIDLSKTPPEILSLDIRLDSELP